MNWKSHALVASCVLSLAAVGCGGDDGPGDGDDDCTTGETQFYWVDTFDLGYVEENRSPGFNLDGENSTEGGSTGCGKMDYTSPIDDVSGVDNQVGPIVESTVGSVTE